MNLALSTLIFFLFLIPGIVFRRLYYSEEFSKQYFKESLFAVFISTILPSLLFQTLWYFGSYYFTSYKVDMEVFGSLISSNPASSVFKNLEDFSIEILIYQLSMLLIAAGSGYIFRKIVRYKNWDRSLKILRFQNNWHYILKGEFYDFPRANISLITDSVRDIEFVFVDALIETNNGCYIYDGFLVDYELSSDGGLDTITLAETERRKLSDDKTIEEKKTGSYSGESPYYPIEGHMLLLKYCEIKNLNFTYFTLDRTEDDAFIPRKVK